MKIDLFRREYIYVVGRVNRSNIRIWGTEQYQQGLSERNLICLCELPQKIDGQRIDKANASRVSLSKMLEN